jgi:flavodoxin
MKALVVYDSAYGNTERIAQVIGEALGAPEEVSVQRAGTIKTDPLTEVRLLIVGSPTQRFRPLPTISSLLKGLAPNSLKGVHVAAFDTRLSQSNIDETPVLAFFVKLIGRGAYAAGPIADQLKKKGGKLVGSPAGFYVEGMEGPLVQGELERAQQWAKQILAAIHLISFPHREDQQHVP